ncbi:baculoviral IAP repeat-containing protein 2 [Spea bombifrons]|uniref:baculoviral IAP repeat-containing protein 2 n=1 Tax=Spea bombifrons TaxID=233779 RepID=UPI002348FA1E|nr:baculoviral IAP repeat-containing protein 2 [Spea bombifrons]
MEVLNRSPYLANLVKASPNVGHLEYELSCELYRISTFATFPGNVPVSERSLAKAGFYYTGTGDKVKCFKCPLMLDNWKRGDDPVEKHKRLYPSCSFIQNVPSVNLGPSLNSAFSPPSSTGSQGYATCSGFGDVEVITKTYTSIPQDPVTSRAVVDLTHLKHTVVNSGMLTEEERLRTFSSWPLTYLKPYDLAKAGFYFVGPGDKVACFSCHGKLNNWEPNDNAMSEHRKHFPECQFVKNSANASSTYSVSNVSMQTCSSRLKTFISWPSRIPVPPKKLAESGFYYVGRNDDVKCFCCDGGLRCWESGDDPWVEHAKWFPRCEYLLQIKGQRFVQEIQEKYPHLLDQLLSASDIQNSETQHPPIIRLGVESSAEDEMLMSSEMVQSALEMGFDRRLVQQTIKSKMLTTGENYNDLEVLITDLLKAQEEQTEEDRDRQAEESTSDEIILLRRSRLALSHCLNSLLLILNDLLSADVLTPSEYESIKQKTPSAVQVLGLIDIVLAKGSSAVVAFKNTLKANDPNIFRELYLEQSLKSSDDCSDLSMEEQLRRLQEERTCKICMDQEVSIVFIPCGHLVVCKDCAPSLRKCPICRGTIKGTVRTFLS